MADVNTDLSDCNYIVNTSTLPNYTFSSNVPGNVTVSTASANSILSGTNGSGGYLWNSNSSITTHATLDVKGDAHFSGDIEWNGRSLGKLLETIENRLSILTPDPAKLEHFESLQKAYNHYKTLEALCELPKKQKE